MLERQREFVADASHELRTPLTSVLANLELLAEELDGEQAESAEAALRSTRRMRRLVGDLLLLARADARRAQPRRADRSRRGPRPRRRPSSGPMAESHELSIDAEPAVVAGVRDDLHRLVAQPARERGPATRRRAPSIRRQHRARSTATRSLIVEDDGPGIPAELREQRVRAVRRAAGGDGGRGSGLGLAIVRAVAESHGGTVTLDVAARPAPGRGS